MAEITPEYKRWMGGRLKAAIDAKSIDDALTLIEIWPSVINEDVRYKFWLEQTLRDTIETGSLATVQQIVNAYPPIINEGDPTPLMWAGILCGFLLDLKAEPARIEQLHQIALFLVRHPMIDVLKYRAGSATNRACYYCASIHNDEFRRLLYEKEVAAGSPGKVQCARFLGIRPPVAVPVGGAGGAPSAGQVISAVPIPRKGPGPRTPAEIAAAASREAGGENANWESISLDERAMKGGRRKTKKSKKQKRRYRKSQRRHFL
jgi:hypothetical protein